MLESEEINQLLKNEADFNNEQDSLPENEKEGIKEIFKEPLKALGSALGKIISNSCEIADTVVEVVKGSLIKETLDEENYFMQDITFNNNDKMDTTLVTDIQVIKKISAVILEAEASDSPLSDSEKSVWIETIEQMSVAFAKSLSKQIQAKYETSVNKEKPSEIAKKENVIQISFTLKTETGIDTTIYFLISFEMMKDIISKIKATAKETPSSTSTGKKGKEEPSEKEELEERSATVQPVIFEEFTENVSRPIKENIELLMDLQLQVSVELGKVKKPIKEILQFTEGTIVELERLAGDNVDVLVSGKVIARGEVVVVDQNFGVRITQIVTPDKRV